MEMVKLMMKIEHTSIKHKAPLTRLNIKYQRMMMGAAAYASSHHIGVGFGSSSYIQGVPYKFDANGNVINTR